MSNTKFVVFSGGCYSGKTTTMKKAKEIFEKRGLKVVMLTGDNKKTAQAVANKLGIDEVHADVSPEDKNRIIKEMQDSGKLVAMAGDGINDAPALAQADVGIAMGGLGSDATIETADVVIQDDKPSKIPMAIHSGSF